MTYHGVASNLEERGLEINRSKGWVDLLAHEEIVESSGVDQTWVVMRQRQTRGLDVAHYGENDARGTCTHEPLQHEVVELQTRKSDTVELETINQRQGEKDVVDTWNMRDKVG